MKEDQVKHPGDGPFLEVVARATAAIARGAATFQKFTCAGCGQRLTMETPDAFYEEGLCDQCPTVTNIREQGCGFAAIFARDRSTLNIVLGQLNERRN